MAIELTEKIDIKIKLKDTVSVYNVLAYLVLSPEKEQAFEAFKSEQEEKNAAMEKAIEVGKQLSKQVVRLGEDIDDLNDEIEDAEDKVLKRELQSKRKKLRKAYRKAEDALEAHNAEHDITSYQKSMTDLMEAVAKESFDLNIEDDEKKEALVKAMETHNIKYSMLVSEISKLITEAKKKKKKRS